MSTSARKALATLRKVARHFADESFIRKDALASRFNPEDHPRYPKGHPLGGQFIKAEHNAIALSVPSSREIYGRKTTTLLELSAIAADTTGKLTENEVSRLHLVRNGFDSFEDFLESPHELEEESYQDPMLYAGKRVIMTISDEGDVIWTIDGSARAIKSGTKPSEELIGMQSIFSEYLKSPASKRLLFNTPLYDTKEQFEMRVKHYERNGFISVKNFKNLPERLRKSDVMFLDNRFMPQTFIPLPANPRIAVRGKEVIDNTDDFEW